MTPELVMVVRAEAAAKGESVPKVEKATPDTCGGRPVRVPSGLMAVCLPTRDMTEGVDGGCVDVGGN
jgi:hypothetical protein